MSWRSPHVTIILILWIQIWAPSVLATPISFHAVDWKLHKWCKGWMFDFWLIKWSHNGLKEQSRFQVEPLSLSQPWLLWMESSSIQKFPAQGIVVFSWQQSWTWYLRTQMLVCFYNIPAKPYGYEKHTQILWALDSLCMRQSTKFSKSLWAWKDCLRQYL